MPDIIEVANQLSVFDANLLLQKNSFLESYYTYEFAGNSRYQRRMDRRNDFLEYLQDKHPEDLEFFLWHPEIEENKWFRDGVIHDE